MLLAIETSTSAGSVALGDGDVLRAEVVLGDQSRHAEALVPAIDMALSVAGADRSAIDGVVVGAGPGSFTGVRVGGATAKGLVRALDVPLYAYPGLLALAAVAGAEDGPVCALFDARRGEVYAACYRLGDGIEQLLAPTVAPLEDVLDALDGVLGAHAAPGTPDRSRDAPELVVGGAAGAVALFAGDGARRYRALIEAQGGRVAASYRGAPRASALLWLATTWPGAGLVAEPASWEPEYLRAPGAMRGVQG